MARFKNFGENKTEFINDEISFLVKNLEEEKQIKDYENKLVYLEHNGIIEIQIKNMMFF